MGGVSQSRSRSDSDDDLHDDVRPREVERSVGKLPDDKKGVSDSGKREKESGLAKINQKSLTTREVELGAEELRKEELRKEGLRAEELRKEELRKEELRKEELRKEELRKEELRKGLDLIFPEKRGYFIDFTDSGARLFRARKQFLGILGRSGNVLLYEGGISVNGKEGKGVEFDASGFPTLKGYFENNEWVYREISGLADPYLKSKQFTIAESELVNSPVIGMGSSCTVYRIWRRGQEYAVKVFISTHKDKLIKEEIVMTFAMNHANILKGVFYCFRKDQLKKMIAVELCDKSVADVILKEKPLGEKLDILLGVCDGMIFLHKTKTIHRDLKWSNVLLRQQIPKICDFGISKHLETLKESVNTGFRGTAGFIAPEVLALRKNDGSSVKLGVDKVKEKYTKKVDVFSFGIMMYQLIFGKTDSDLDELFYDRTELASFFRNTSKKPSLLTDPNCYPKIETEWIKNKAIEKLVKLMRNCYDHDPSKRKEFSEIKLELELIFDLLDSSQDRKEVKKLNPSRYSAIFLKRNPKFMKSKRTVSVLEKLKSLLGISRYNVLKGCLVNVLFDVFEKKIGIDKALSVWLKWKESWGMLFRVVLDPALDFAGNPMKAGPVAVRKTTKGTLFRKGCDTILFRALWRNGVMIKKTKFELPMFEKDFSFVKNMKKEDYLGEGTFFIVHKICFEGQEMACKITKPRFVRNKDYVRGFKNTLKMIFSLYHPNIVSFYGYSLKDKTLGILLELGKICMNRLIHGCLRNEIRIPFSTKVKILLEVGKAVKYLHQPNIKIIHRDLKWENVLITDSGLVKLFDFGASEGDTWKRVRQVEKVEDVVEVSKNTKTVDLSDTLKVRTGMKGTNWYIAPEIVKLCKDGKTRYNRKVDQFSFSIMMYILLFDVHYGNPHYELTKLYYGNMDELKKDPSLRPQLTVFEEKIGKKEATSVKKWIVDLMIRCWDPIPQKRPEFDSIVKELETQYERIQSSEDDLVLLIKTLEKQEKIDPKKLSDDLLHSLNDDLLHSFDFPKEVVRKEEVKPETKTSFEDVLHANLLRMSLFVE